MRFPFSPLFGLTMRRVFGDPTVCLRRLLVAASLALCPTASRGADAPSPPDKVMATVNGEKITQSDLDKAAEDVGANIPGTVTGQARDTYLLDYLIDSTLVLQRAREDMVDSSPQFLARLKHMRTKLLIDGELDRAAEHATSEAGLREIYDELVLQAHAQHKDLPPFEQFKPNLSVYAAKKAEAELIAELKKTAKIERPVPGDNPPSNGR